MAARRRYAAASNPAMSFMASSTLGSSSRCMCPPPGRAAWRELCGRGQRRRMPPWLLDPMSSTHNESRLAACPLSDVPGCFCTLSTNTQASWKMCRFVCPGWTGLSTNASCQLEKPESSHVKTWGSPSTVGVERALPGSLSSNWRDCAARKNLRNVADTGEKTDRGCCQQNRPLRVRREK